MGADYKAKAVIGVRIANPAKLYTKRIVKAFEHNYPKDKNFCSATGKKLWVEVNVPIDAYNERTEKLFEYNVIHGTDQEEVFVCIAAATDTYSNGGKDSFKVDLPANLEQRREKLKADLSAIGLWHDNEFGLWAVLYCSY